MIYLLSSTCCRLLVIIPNARIQPAIGQISHEVDQQKGGDDEEHVRLEDRVVSVMDGLNCQAPHAWPSVDGLNDDGAAEQVAQLQTQNRDHRNERIGHAMLRHNDAAAQTLGMGRAYIILVQHLQQG